MNLLDLMDAPPTGPPGITWDRFPGWNGGSCGARFRMLKDGKPTGAWVVHCGHPTANRPYYVETHGWVLARKHSRLANAKAMALASIEAGFDENEVARMIYGGAG